MRSAFADEFLKIAAGTNMELAKLLGGSALAYGAGSIAGVGLGHLGNKAYKMLTKQDIPKQQLLLAAPLLGAGAGIAYAMYKAKEQEEVRRVLENPTDARGT